LIHINHLTEEVEGRRIFRNASGVLSYLFTCAFISMIFGV